MSVYKNSRFDGSFVYADTENPDINFLTPFREVKYPPDKTDYIYQVKQGERLDIIAHNFYGNSRLEWVIMDANPFLFSPLDIYAGQRLRIPEPRRVEET